MCNHARSSGLKAFRQVSFPKEEKKFQEQKARSLAHRNLTILKYHRRFPRRQLLLSADVSGVSQQQIPARNQNM